MWMELSFREEIRHGLLMPKIVDHFPEIESLLLSIGLDFETSADAIRIYGYAPRDRSGFKPKEAEQDATSNH